MLSEALGRRRLLLGLLALLALLLATMTGLRPAAAAPSADDARALIQTVGAEVLDVLRDGSLSDQQKFDRLVELLSGPIDLDLVGRLILGRYWRTASDEQRAEYLKLFRAFALGTLASKLHVYKGQDFQITGAKPVSDNDVLVSTNILSNEGPPLAVDWRLRERDGNGFVAIDVIVEGVSMIVTQRSEFGSVIERQGFDALLDELRHRIQRQA
jgi:phospholipid transport system substrate-binding protein